MAEADALPGRRVVAKDLMTPRIASAVKAWDKERQQGPVHRADRGLVQPLARVIAPHHHDACPMLSPHWGKAPCSPMDQARTKPQEQEKTRSPGQGQGNRIGKDEHWITATGWNALASPKRL